MTPVDRVKRLAAHVVSGHGHPDMRDADHVPGWTSIAIGNGREWLVMRNDVPQQLHPGRDALNRDEFMLVLRTVWLKDAREWLSTVTPGPLARIETASHPVALQRTIDKLRWTSARAAKFIGCTQETLFTWLDGSARPQPRWRKKILQMADMAKEVGSESR